MENKLQAAIAAARSGDKRAAQQQLVLLLKDNPQQDQGWYLLSLLVDSPQKQSTYLSKTLALNPNHEKARQQLAALQQSGRLAPTATVDVEALQEDTSEVESPDLPDWLLEKDEAFDEAETAVPPEDQPEVETAVEDEVLPDWLKEPAALTPDPIVPPPIIDESPTLVGKSAAPASKSDKVVAELKPTLIEPKAASARRAKQTRSAAKNTRTLNLILGILIFLAVVVIFLLAYLLLS